MAKTIKMTRSELVWETREVEWTEVDFNRLKKWLAGYAEKEIDQFDNYSKEHVLAYEHIKDMTWEDLVADFKKWQDDDENAIHWTVTNHYAYSDDYTYEVYLGELVQEWIREDCYDADVTDVDYADDYDEELEVLEDDEDEEGADA